jgi:UDP-GlcNAc:undecaprenyl-phosphate/decaprenyl-phosphate GlcNAc-1-phosphate transferase
MDYLYFISFLASLLISMAMIFVFRMIAKKIGLVDKPNARKLHTDLIPLVGGIGVFLAVLATMCILKPTIFSVYNIRNMFFGASVMLVMGVLDDRFDLRAALKLTIQLLLAHFMYYHGISIDSLHGVFGIYEIPIYMQHILTLLVITGVVNAFNLMDGIDGLAAGLSIVSFIALAALSFYLGNMNLALVFTSFTGALLGFLWFNFSKKHKTFMGDAGSLVLGFILVSSSILLLKSANTPEQISIVFPCLLGIMLLPVFDSLRVYIRRLKSGKSPFKADRTHIHHLVLQLGLKHRRASLLIVLLVVLIVSIGVWTHSTLGITVTIIVLIRFFIAITNLLQLNSDINFWKVKIKELESSEIIK